VFQAFLTTFLTDSGYETPIQSIDELFGSGLKLAYPQDHSSVFVNYNEAELSNVGRMNANCPSIKVCEYWAKYYKNVSVFFSDNNFQIASGSGIYVGENGEPLLCKIDDGVFFNAQCVLIMFYGEPLLKRINEIFDRVVEAGIYKFWVSRFINHYRITFSKIAIVNPLDEYYSFNLHHLQPAFYLLLMGLCLSVFCFVIELFCCHLLNKRK
jgi:hypothetical protein